MKNILYFIKILVLSFSLLACNKSDNEDQNNNYSSVSYKLRINSMSVNDPNAIGGDQNFTSLAMYVFNNDASNTLDRHALLYLPTSMSSYDVPIKSTAGVKYIYIIANYDWKILKSSSGVPIVLSANTTKAQLDDLIVESPSGFISNSLIMVGKGTINLEPNNDCTTAINLRHLQSRVDVHVYKGSNFGNANVVLKSIELGNQVLNSKVEFDYTLTTTSMLNSPSFNVQSKTIANTVVPPYSSSVVLTPSNADAIFYSFQNLVNVSNPLPVQTPYIKVNVEYNGIPKTFKAYITDDNQINNKYSLLQNNVYRILAKIDLDSRMDLALTILPWNKLITEDKRPIVASDFIFNHLAGSWGGLNAKTIYNQSGLLEDAVFEFELKTPINAQWTASVTNGLEFGFVNSTTGLTQPTVSSGSANSGVKSYIAIRPTKPWTGTLRNTEFYITVDGQEIVINPVVGGSRVYPGTDTRILIKQVATY